MSTSALTLHQYAASSSPLIKRKETFRYSVESNSACVEIGFSLLKGLAGESLHATNKLRQML